MKLLTLETGGLLCSAALHLDGSERQRSEAAPARHAERILPMIDALLGEAGIALAALDGIGFGRGPGTFIGVRTAAGVAQGLAFAADLPVAPVSSLAALAQAEVRRHGQVLAAMDARMGEVYWGCYRADPHGLARAVDEETLAAPDRVPLPQGGAWFGVGTAWALHARTLQERLGERLLGWEADRHPQAGDLMPLALDMAARGALLPAEQAAPTYLRTKVATPPG